MSESREFRHRPLAGTMSAPFDDCLYDVNFDGINDVIDAMELCEARNVPYDGLENMDEFIERLRLHVIKQRNTESRKTRIEKSMLRASQDDANRRQKLEEFITTLTSLIQGGGESGTGSRISGGELVEENLRREGTTRDFQADCRDHISAIQENECLFIVAGETSAGKSSVLNLLFEHDILPVHNNSSTSTITVVRYHSNRHARIVYKSDRPSEEFDLDPEGMERLKNVAFMKTAIEREGHEVREVQVYLPLPLLQGGLVLVDTPGIGENEFLEAELMNFIGSHHIRGFVYIIKTDNAGGVQEDRLLNLLKIVIEQQRSRSDLTGRHTTFDPKSALFVCNRVDLVSKDELEKVKKNAIEKLSACWPSFDESQVVFFSTEKALRDVQADTDYINDNYKQLLDALKDLFISALEKRVKSSYKWIESVLKRSDHYLRTIVKRLDMTDMDLNEKSEVTLKKLQNLQKKSQWVLQELNDKVDTKARELNEVMKSVVKTPKCMEYLTSNWSTRDVPDVDGGLGDWQWIRTRIQEAFFDRLMTYIEIWEREEEIVDGIESDIACEVKAKLDILQDELDGIESEIRGDSSSNSSDGEISALTKSRRQSLLNLTPIKLKYRLTEPKLPIKLAARVTKPFKAVLEHITNKIKVSDFINNPVKVAKQYSQIMYSQLGLTQNGPDAPLLVIANYLVERPRDYLDAIKRRIPDMILSNQLYLRHIEDSLESERQHQSEYIETMIGIEQLRKSLRTYGEGYILVEDFSRGELQIQRDQTEDGKKPFNACEFMRSSSGGLDTSQRRDIRGLWTVTYSGVLVRNGVERPVGIRVYLPSSGVECTLNEVARLRCLTWKDTGVAEFLGIHNADAICPAFVYDGDLRSLRKTLASTFLNMRELIPEVLLGVASGLEYLHNKGMVHMELTQDTVTVDEDGEVRLTGACLPRKAVFPTYRESIYSGDFVHLAPEVLTGDVYKPTADIYAFGLLVIELTNNDMPKVFAKEREMTLYDFTERVQPDVMLNLEQTVNIYTVKTRALIENCLQMDPNDRPHMREVVEYTDNIKYELDALDKFPTRKTRAHVKSYSFDRTLRKSMDKKL
ncbi:uncharacterized protein LOC127844925 isoform X2 [Dreissena polymorpha]|uniref:Protein kinase domain-containing protein n=1 Tax=Dreissena polymorpha TaxID=45954 RepID=A0A9D4EDE1_DREPO|nr:uncharacterized protein LOC127844925 isoform X2 [Dreissena polymorpha]KAH3777653.1 hypothetical protein DPMN_179101 [Dreissena polymorpha]